MSMQEVLAELLEVSKKMDIVLNDIGEKNQEMREELLSKLDENYQKMFFDVKKFREYMIAFKVDSISLDTGINVRGIPGETMHLVVSVDNESIALEHLYKPYNISYRYGLFSPTQKYSTVELPFPNSHGKAILGRILEEWDEAYQNMEQDFVEQIRMRITRNVDDATSTFSKLNKQVARMSGKQAKELFQDEEDFLN